MGAQTKVYVRVLVTKEVWYGMYARSLDEAKTKAKENIVGAVHIIDATYEEPNDEDIQAHYG